MKLSFSEVRLIFDLLNRYLEEQGVSEISFADTDYNYYIKIWVKDMAKALEVMAHDNRSCDGLPFTVGSLSDDIGFIQEKIEDEELPPFDMDLEKMGIILSAYGDVLNLEKNICNDAPKNNDVDKTLGLPEVIVFDTISLFGLKNVFERIMYFFEEHFESYFSSNKIDSYLRIPVVNTYNFAYLIPDDQQDLFVMGSFVDDIKKLNELIVDKRIPNPQDWVRFGVMLTSFAETLA